MYVDYKYLIILNENYQQILTKSEEFLKKILTGNFYEFQFTVTLAN